MIEPVDSRRFLTGRLGGLAAQVAVQLMLARAMSARAYADYALVLAWCALIQTLAGLGVQRAIAKYLSRAGDGLSAPAAWRLLWAAIGVRAGVGTAVAGAAALGRLAGLDAGPLLGFGVAYGVATALQSDLDAVAQALRRQSAARLAAIGEPVARLAALGVFIVIAGAPDAAVALAASTASAAGAAALLFWSAMDALKTLTPSESHGPPWREVLATAWGGHGGTLAWAASSPAVVRLLASRVLPTEVFAGFSVMQGLTVSLQRYAPSFILLPLLEPAAQADAARRGRLDRLRAVLALLVKIDVIVVGSAVVMAAAAGEPVLGALTHGRYGAATGALPWLLLTIVAGAAHRAYEVAAVAAGAAKALGRSLWISAAGLALAATAGRGWGLTGLLLWPLADAVLRLSYVQSALSRRGLGDLLDVSNLLKLAALVALFALSGGVAAWLGGPAFGIATGVLATGGFLIGVLLCRPLRADEAALLRTLAQRRDGTRPLRVTMLTPRGEGGVGGVDRLTDSLRGPLGASSTARVRFLATRGPWRWASPFVTVMSLTRLAAEIAMRRVDLVHAPVGAGVGFWRKSLFIGLCRTLGAPYVLHLHGSAFERFWRGAPPVRRWAIERAFGGAARIVTLGEPWRRLVVTEAPHLEPRIVVLPNAAPAFAGERAPPDGVTRLLFLGEIGERKGVGVLVQALAKLPPEPPWRAVIAGEGDSRPYAAAAARLGLADRVAFPGWTGPEGVRRLLAASDVLVLPSFEENLPLAIVEAFAAGLAVAATPVGAVGDIVKHEETGLLVPPGAVDDLAAALQRLIADPDLRRRLGTNAKALHAKRLSLAAYVETLLKIWDAAARTANEPLHEERLKAVFHKSSALD